MFHTQIFTQILILFSLYAVTLDATLTAVFELQPMILNFIINMLLHQYSHHFVLCLLRVLFNFCLFCYAVCNIHVLFPPNHTGPKPFMAITGCI